MTYKILVFIANLFAVVFRQEVTFLDRVASWFEPTQETEQPKAEHPKEFVYWNIPEGKQSIGL